MIVSEPETASALRVSQVKEAPAEDPCKWTVVHCSVVIFVLDSRSSLCRHLRPRQSFIALSSSSSSTVVHCSVVIFVLDSRSLLCRHLRPRQSFIALSSSSSSTVVHCSVVIFVLDSRSSLCRRLRPRQSFIALSSSSSLTILLHIQLMAPLPTVVCGS
ncbi:hypothetical protein ACOMHN_009513 [Nucella lapillus]